MFKALKHRWHKVGVFRENLLWRNSWHLNRLSKNLAILLSVFIGIAAALMLFATEGSRYRASLQVPALTPECPEPDSFYEPNNIQKCAFGPLRLSYVYKAAPNDMDDWYYFVLSKTASIRIKVTNYQTATGQLVLYEDDLSRTPSRRAIASDGRNFETMEVPNRSNSWCGPDWCELVPGKYYVRVYTSAGSHSKEFYRLVITSKDPLVQLSKVADPSNNNIYYGQYITFSILYSNTGVCPLENIVISDTIPTNTWLVSSDVLTDSGVIYWDIGHLTATEKGQVSFVVQVVDLLNSAAMISTRADFADSLNWLWPPAVIQDDWDTGMDATPLGIESGKLRLGKDGADLAITKISDPPSVIAGTALTFTITIVNSGTVDAENVIVTDTLPVGLSLLEPLPSGCIFRAEVGLNGIVVCELDTIDASGEDQRTLKLQAETSTSITMSLFNQVTVGSVTDDIDLADNSCGITTQVSTVADLEIDQKDNPEQVERGGNLTHTLIITNNGPADARNLTVYDILSEHLTYSSSIPKVDEFFPMTWYTDVLVAGDVWTIAVTSKVRGSAEGFVRNIGIVHSEVFDPDSKNNVSEEHTLAPVVVVNVAFICESGLWCERSNAVIYSPHKHYLPIVIKDPTN